MPPDASQPDCPQGDRRRDPRQGLVAKAMLFNDDGVGAPCRVELRNISVRGCGFAVNGPMEIGQRFKIRIEMGPMRFASPMRVISSRPIGFGAHEVGAEFLRTELGISDGATLPLNAPHRVPRTASGILRPAI